MASVKKSNKTGKQKKFKSKRGFREKQRAVKSTTEDLRDLLWKDVPTDLRFRRQVWAVATMQHIDKKENFPKFHDYADKELSHHEGQELELILEPYDNYKRFCGSAPFSEQSEQGNGDVSDIKVEGPTIKRVLSAYALAFDIKRFPAGSVAIAAVILNVLDNNESKAFQTFAVIMRRLKPYTDKSALKLRTECLVLADVLSHHHPDLKEHFNGIGFDVIDLADIVCSWCLPLFTDSFSFGVVLRVIDVVLVEGPSVLVTISHGIFTLFKNQMLQCKNDTAFFQELSFIPEAFQSLTQIKFVFEDAYSVFTMKKPQGDSNAITIMSAQKSWNGAVSLPGVLKFANAVGDAIRTRQELKSLPDPLKDPEDIFSQENDTDIRARIPSLDVYADSKEDHMHCQLLEENRKLDRQVTDLKTKITDLEKEIGDEFVETPGAFKTNGDRLVRFATSPAHLRHKSQVKDKFGTLEFNPDDYHITKPEYEIVSAATTPIKEEGKEVPTRYSNFEKTYSAALDELEFPCLYMQGYLLKMGRPGTIFGRQNLHRRFFVLKGQYLTYFKSHLHNKPQKDKCVDLGGKIIKPLKGHPKGEFAIEISTPNEVSQKDALNLDMFDIEDDESQSSRFVLFANDAEKRDRWVAALLCATRKQLFD